MGNMSYVVATMKKMKIENLGGIQRHNQREFKNHSNKEIDPSRTNQNYDLVNSRPINYQEKIMDYINANKKSTRAVRKDAVIVDEWIISSDNEFFKGIDNPESVRAYFETAKRYFEKNYGESNIKYANVHLDETTPHMHMGIVPLTKDGRLSSKTFFTRQELKKIQDDLPKYMQEHGFAVERGHEDGERKKLTVKEYKDMQREKKEFDAEIRSMALDVISEVRPETKVKDEVFDKHRQKTNDLVSFSNRYGFESRPVATPEGRNQIGDWFSLKILMDLAKKYAQEFFQKLRKRKEEIDKKTSELRKMQEKEIPLVQEQINAKQQELDNYKAHQMWNMRNNRGPKL